MAGMGEVETDEEVGAMDAGEMDEVVVMASAFAKLEAALAGSS